MAHWLKNKEADAKRIMHEAFRSIDSQSEYFDKSKSKNNKYLWSEKDAAERLKRALEIKHRKDAVVLMSEIITLPKEVKPKDKNLFWKSVIDFNNQKLGKENLIYCAIHYDEFSPHMHIAYTPIKEDRFQCKNIMNQQFLQNYHNELQEYIDKVFNYHVSVIRDEIDKQFNKWLEYKEYKIKMKQLQKQQEQEIELTRQ